MMLGPANVSASAPHPPLPTLSSILDEQEAVTRECLNIAEQVIAAFIGPGPVGAEGPVSAPPSLNQRVESQTKRLAVLREKLIQIGQQL